MSESRHKTTCKGCGHSMKFSDARVCIRRFRCQECGYEWTARGAQNDTIQALITAPSSVTLSRLAKQLGMRRQSLYGTYRRHKTYIDEARSRRMLESFAFGVRLSPVIDGPRPMYDDGDY